MKAFSYSGSVPHHPFLLGGLALLFLTACATTKVAQEADPSGVEAIDIGYGTINEDHSVGSVTKVQGEVPEEGQPRTMAEMLYRVPGIQVTELSGGRLSVSIRGSNSFLGGTEPLYVYNGMVVPDVTGINPTTIESISVLKNADATAIYGSRGANGVILIKTKVRFK